jgi:D-alanyl-D-alanine carboxypeptidase/D-alanyl-D-alanine-endopeptidase (penicillin-binding protein 4)
MNRRSVTIAVMLLLLAMAQCGGPLRRGGIMEGPVDSDPIGHLQRQLHQLLASPDLSNAFWGILVRSVDTGQIILAHNEDKSFVPASNVKLFTTAVALQELGPGFRYITEIYGSGEMDSEGTLTGSLIISGAGDPTISGRFNGGDIAGTFRDWADSLAIRGVEAIRGDIIGDDDIFDDQALGTGWSWDYQTQWYAAQVSGLSFNDNCIDIDILPGQREGQLADISLQPMTSYATVRNQLITCPSASESDWEIYRQPETNRVEIRGQIPQDDDGYHGWFTIHNPTLFAATVFKEVLQAEGIAVGGRAQDIDQLEKESLTGYRQEWTKMGSYFSPALADIIKVINKRSQNLYAEQLLKTLGASIRGQGSFAGGIEVISAAISKMGIPQERFVMVDGSGLSRRNLVSPKDVVALLDYMAGQENFHLFRDSLPLAGVDGTLARRMADTSAENRIWAKTGTLDRASALSGYAYSLDEELLAFSVMVNHYTVPTSMVEDLQDSVCQLLTGFSRSGT